MTDPAFDMPDATAPFESRGGWLLNKLVAEFGLTNVQAAGIVGNLGGESGLRAIQEVRPISGRGGFGWAQWTGSRRTEFEHWCADHNLQQTADEANYGFLVNELHTTQAHAIQQLKKVTALEAAVYTFEATFERPFNLLSGLSERVHFARRAMEGATPAPDSPELALIKTVLAWLKSSGQDQMLAKLDTILANQEIIMSDMDNLNQAISDLKTEVGAIATEMDTLLADLKAALASNNTAAIQQATADIQAQVDVLKSAGTRDAPGG